MRTQAQRNVKHVLELAEHVRDMGGRVVANGGEINYASEKLGRAAEDALMALAIMGESEDYLKELAERAHQRGRWMRGERDEVLP